MSSETIAEKTKKYRSLIDNKDANGLNLQARLVVEASIVKEKLVKAFGPCVTILSPPDSLTNQIFSGTGGSTGTPSSRKGNCCPSRAKNRGWAVR
jgi:hypothetical protein